MTLPILIQPANGQFSASLAGSPEFRCVGPTRDEAVAALACELTERMAAGELVKLEIPATGVTSLAGRFADDSTLGDIREEIYRARSL